MIKERYRYGSGARRRRYAHRPRRARLGGPIDIAARGFGAPGIDFLACRTVPEGCRSIVTNPPYGNSGSHAGQSRSPTAMLNFLRHALILTASVQGQLALLVRLSGSLVSGPPR